MATRKSRTVKKGSMPLIVRGIYKDIPLTIYGENHADIDNSFYEKLDLTEAIVMVEHSTEYCVLQPGEEALFKAAKGSEWVWFTRTVNKQPVMCIDSRLADGFLNRLEEEALKYGRQVSMEALFLTTKQILMATIKIKQKFLPIKDEYTHLVAETQDLFKQLIMNLKNEERNDAVVEQLIDNLLKLSSLSMDMNVIEKIDQYAATAGEPKKEIILFVGAAHALRLQQILNLEIISGDTSLLKSFKGGRKRTRGKKTIKKRRKNRK